MIFYKFLVIAAWSTTQLKNNLIIRKLFNYSDTIGISWFLSGSHCPTIKHAVAPSCKRKKLQVARSIRATSHTSQGSWRCTGEGPWLSSEGCTMGVGIVILCSHGSSSIVWIENGPCWKPIVHSIGGKRGATLSHSLYIFFFSWVSHRWGRKD
jgi:hypothetical protein